MKANLFVYKLDTVDDEYNKHSMTNIMLPSTKQESGF